MILKKIPKKVTKNKTFVKFVEDLMRANHKHLSDYIRTVDGQTWISHELYGAATNLPKRTITLGIKPHEQFKLQDFYDTGYQTVMTEKVFETLGKESFKEYNRKIMRDVTGMRSSTWKAITSSKSGRLAVHEANPRMRAQICLGDYLVTLGYDPAYASALAKQSDMMFELIENNHI
jgi:hypothetical protein